MRRSWTSAAACSPPTSSPAGRPSWSWSRQSRSCTARAAAPDRSRIAGPVTAETPHHGRAGHSQGPRVPHERQRIVDLTLVSFLLVTPAPEQNPHCPNRGGGLAEGLSSVAASSDQKYPRIPWKLCGKFCSEVRTSSCRPLKPCSSGSSRRTSLLTFDTWRQVLIRGTLAHLGSSAEIFVQRYGPLLADL